MNTKSKMKAMARAALFLPALCICGCTSVSGSENYEAKTVTTTETPDGTKKKVEEGVKKQTTNSKTEVEKPSWLIELATTVLKFFA